MATITNNTDPAHNYFNIKPMKLIDGALTHALSKWGCRQETKPFLSMAIASMMPYYFCIVFILLTTPMLQANVKNNQDIPPPFTNWNLDIGLKNDWCTVQRTYTSPTN